MIVVYRYGLLGPTLEARRVRDQMHLAHRYRNALVEIERGRRRMLRAMLHERAHLDPLEAASVRAEAAAGEAVRAMRAARGQPRSAAEMDALRQAVRRSRAAAKEARVALQAARQAARSDPEIAAEQERIDEQASARRREARAQCGVYWGTYLRVEAADNAARKVPLFEGAKPKDPEFVRWRGEGTVAVQLQGGLPVSEAFGDDSCLRIGACETRSVGPEERPAPHKDFRTLWLRVGSEGRSPIWAHFPLLYHRPLPPQGVLKAVSVRLKRIGPREEWSASFTIEVADAPRAAGGSGAAAVHLGWRAVEGELRVATWQGADGGAGELRLPRDLVAGLRKPGELRSVRDKRFNAARDELAAWLAKGPAVPDWFSRAAERLEQWRAPARLAALALRWRSRRFPGDEDAHQALESWRFKDHHLWQWESSQRSKSLRRRRDLYRVFAAGLATRYAVLVLENVDLRAAARLPSVDAEERPDEDARSLRQLAAVSELRFALNHAFRARAGRVDGVAASSGQACHLCGSVESYAPAATRHTCSGCGATWDPDQNACATLLGGWRETASS